MTNYDGNVHVMPVASGTPQHIESKDCWCVPDCIDDYTESGGGESLFAQGDTMNAGRELDTLVAEKIFGLTEQNFRSEGWCPGRALEREKCFCGYSGRLNDYNPLCSKQFFPIPYSTKIAAAWEVVEKTGILRDYALGKSCGKWVIADDPLDVPYYDLQAEADTAPLAICLAALKATEKK